MKRKRTLADLVPPGAKFKRDLGLLALWFALFVLLGSFLIFLIRYENARERLYEDVLGRRRLRSGRGSGRQRGSGDGGDGRCCALYRTGKGAQPHLRR